MDTQNQRKGSEAAVGWFVRLHADNVTETARREHAAWLADDEKNRAQYQAVERSMQDLSGIGDWMRAQTGELNRRVMARQGRRHKVWSVGLAAAASVLVAVGYWTLLDPETVYETARAEQREVSLDDGSRIHLNAASRVVVRYTKTSREVELVRGEGVFDVARDEHRPFVATAVDTEVVAVGTQFRLRLAANDVTVTVLEGSVAVSPSGGHAQDPQGAADGQANRKLLTMNDQVTVAFDGRMDVESVDAFAATAWREGKLIFDETPLRMVIKEVARHSPVDIVVADDVPNHPITGLIHIRSPDSMLRFIASAVPVTPVRVSSEEIVLHGSDGRDW